LRLQNVALFEVEAYAHLKLLVHNTNMQQLRASSPIYSLHGVIVATILGSFAAGVVIVCLNYMAFKRPGLAKKVAIAGLIIFIVLDLVTAATTTSFVVGSTTWMIAYIGITLGQVGLAYFAANQLQGQTIKYHFENGGMQHSNFRAAGVGLVTAFAVAFIAIFLSLLFGTGTAQ
tara:strand:+ start:248 stop:769 length:522 start_codon:yes stop_codon:yes gene_type:complete